MTGPSCLRPAASILLLLSLAACNTAPPRPWLRFSAASQQGFVQEADGRLRHDLGTLAVFIDLGKRETRIELTVENRGQGEVEVKAGADGASPTAAIGEVWRRPIGSDSVEHVPEAVPHRAFDPIAVPAGWRAVFFLDSPLGRELVLGQQLMFNLETRDPSSGLHDHVTLPLVATNAPPAAR